MIDERADLPRASETLVPCPRCERCTLCKGGSMVTLECANAWRIEHVEDMAETTP